MRQFFDPFAAGHVKKALLSCPCAELAVDEHDLIKLRVELRAAKQANPYFCQNRRALFGQQEGYALQQVGEDKRHNKRVLDGGVVGGNRLAQDR